jgi:hypothetical protein
MEGKGEIWGDIRGCVLVCYCVRVSAMACVWGLEIIWRLGVAA